MYKLSEFYLRLLYLLAIFFVVIIAAITPIYGIVQSLRQNSSTDFHSYWISGIFLRQNIDPYTAYLNNYQLELPVKFIDKNKKFYSDPHQDGLANVPANTAPVLLILYPLSYFSWNTAKYAWLIVNYILLFAIPLSLIKIFSIFGLSNFKKSLIILLFLGLYGTRNTISSGQTTFLIFYCMLIALLFSNRSTFISSFCLGISLSKYSIALPIVVIFLLGKKYRTLIHALGFQVICLLIVSLSTYTSPLSILNAYIKIAFIHVDLPGIHLNSVFQSKMIAATLSLLLFIVIYMAYQKSRVSILSSSILSQMVFYCLLAAYSLLVAYHRAYDTIIMLPFFAITIIISSHLLEPNSQKYKFILIPFAVLFYISLINPASGISLFVNVSRILWIKFQQSFISFMLILSIFINFALISKIDLDKIEQSHKLKNNTVF